MKRLTLFMLADGVYITRSFNQVKVKVISNIQCYISTTKILLHENNQWILPTFILTSLVILYSFGSLYKYGRYSKHYMQAFPILNWTITWKNFPTLMLALLGIFFRKLTFISAVKISNIIFSIILISMKFQLTLTKGK